MSTDAQESPELLELHDAHVAAWNELDFDRLAQLYHPNCLIFDSMPPPVHMGWAAFRAAVEPLMRSFSRFRLRTFDRVSRAFQRIDDRIGWVGSRYEVEASIGDQPYRRTGRWTEVYEKREHEWRLIHLHSSDDPEPLE
jgi:ketosteroid isomerase-like protein